MTSSSPAPDGRYKNILIPTDFSDCAKHAFGYGLDLARRYDAHVHLLHVMDPVEGDTYSPLRYSPEAAARDESPDALVYDMLVKAIEAQDAGEVYVMPVKQRGRAVAPGVLAYAEREGIDLIVMGTHGRRGLDHWFIGSVAEEVVRRAPCAVLTVRDQDPPERVELHRVLVPVDFSDHTEGLLRAAFAMAGSFGAQLDVLHVIETLPFLGVFAGAMTAYDLVPDLREQALDRLKHTVAQLNSDEVPVKLHLEDGHVAACIVHLAAQLGADLIVIATHGQSGIEHFLIGSVAERVVRSAACPVLTVKAGAFDA